MKIITSSLVLIAACVVLTDLSAAFVPITTTTTTRTRSSSSISSFMVDKNAANDNDDNESSWTTLSRRDLILMSSAAAATVGSSLLFPFSPAHADDNGGDDESFASIAARASQISKDKNKEAAQATLSQRATDKTVYDFSLPVQGSPIPFKDIIQQDIMTQDDGDVRIKAIIVVNIKQDDPVARKTIPELISLAAKYGRGSNGALAVVACPTDQGYYEPDTSQLIRLKLASEYGYGINPSTVVTDKVNLLGTGAHPFWRWIQSTCRTPAGLGRIQGNFEKFLVDGRTGLPVRRYPRKYNPTNMADDIEALIAGKPLPPARANYLEEWRSATAEADRDTYRFEKGLNYFDQ